MRRFLRLKAIALLVLMLVATVSVLPSLADAARFDLPSWITNTFTRKFKLGLDLQGGLHIEYSVAVDEAIETKLDQLAAELERGFSEKKGIKVRAVREGIDTLKLEFDEHDQLALATDDVMGVTYGLLDRMDDGDGDPDNRVITLQMPKDVIAENRTAAVVNALETVRKRVDAMGVAEPAIYPKNHQIVVELPGKDDIKPLARAAVKDVSERLRGALAQGGTDHVNIANDPDNRWAFKLTVPGGNAQELIKAAFGERLMSNGVLADKQLPFELHVVEQSGVRDEASMTFELTEAAQAKVLEDKGDFRRLLRVIERQAVLTMHLVDDETPFRDTGKPYLRAVYEAGLVTEGMGISVNQLSGYGTENGVQVKEPYAFVAKDTETLDLFFNNLPPEWRLPQELKIVYESVDVPTRQGSGGTLISETMYRTHVIKSRASVSGNHILSASVAFNSENGGADVNVKLDHEGARLFEQMSGDNVGRKMAIVLDGLVRSDPFFKERIPGGSVRIEMGGSGNVQSQAESANDLVKVLKSGSLPARLQKEMELRVGADLGADSVARGLIAFITGLGAVVLFMLVYYKRSGGIAVAALVFNMILMLAAMALFGATLTLPGIAGIVLTIGMAVDANVIIFERIREYIHEGYTARAAIESGYDRAFTTIFDAQLTTAIAGLVLYQYGSGPIQGFAVTLMIGIATSIFTGVFCSRLFFDVQANRRGFDKVSI